MIVYTEKGLGLHKAIQDAGHSLSQLDGVWQSSDNTAVQTIIDNYDPLPEAKADAKDRIIREAAKRVHSIYPFIDPDKADVIGFYNYTIDMYSGAMPLPARLQQLKGVRDGAVAAIATINAMTDWQTVGAYDATGW